MNHPFFDKVRANGGNICKTAQENPALHRDMLNEANAGNQFALNQIARRFGGVAATSADPIVARTITNSAEGDTHTANISNAGLSAAKKLGLLS
jgi:hypothetical protein